MPQSHDYFERRLDAKNRLTIPVDVRGEFTTGYVITRGFGKYLHLYPKHIWEREVESALQGDILDEQLADYNVHFRMGKSEGALDQKQGRITLERHQLDHAGLSRQVLAVRAGKYWRLVARSKAPPD